MKITAAGDRALLLDLGDVTAAELHKKAAEMRRVPGVIACIPGHSSLYLIFDRTPQLHQPPHPPSAPSPPQAGAKGLDDLTLRVPSPLQGEKVPKADEGSSFHRVPVEFNGDDLAEFLKRIALSRDAFLDKVRELRLVARYLGFRGGFAYLDGWPPEWAMPRRLTSRPVRRGSFAIAGSVAGFYPIDSPGGWNLLGHTGMNLENAIRAGDELIIEPVKSQEVAATAPRALRPDPWPSVEIITAPLAIVVDRADYSRLERGLPAGGPFDIEAARRANRAAGNDPDAPVLECAFSGPRIRARENVFVAWQSETFRLAAGELRALGRITGGLRAWLAVGNGQHEVEAIRRDDPLTIHAMAGPHDCPVKELVCTVTPQLDRVGIRLLPDQPIAMTAPADLRSCGMQCGTVQLHPDGSLVVMGPDHPVTGGYMQPMTVMSGERWKLARLVPGERVRLVVHWP